MAMQFSISIKKFFVVLSGLIVSLLSATQSRAESPSNFCGPVFNGVIVNFAWECWNDATFLVSQSSRADSNGWQYVQDGGVNDFAGEEFQISGIAFKETSDEIFVAISSSMPFDTAYPAPGALNGSVTFGDIFFNFSGLDFQTASAQRKLFGVRFDSKNDSTVAALGVYKNVQAKSVVTSNYGPVNRQGYENHVINHGGSVGYGDLPANNTYFALNSGLNEIDLGDLVGPVTILTGSGLAAAGFNLSAFTGPQLIGFKFQKTLMVDNCGIVGGDGTSCLDCRGNSCGQTNVDQCGICGGDNSTCADCRGIPNGETQVDECGVCGGDGSSCADCSGTPNGESRIDECGVCGGNGSTCADCKGVPNGNATVDQCGVCGGDGKSCLDCSGKPNGTAQIDRCGTCGGDGQSCLGCQDTDITSTLFTLDGTSGRQAKLLRSALKQLDQASKSKSIKKYVASELIAAEKLANSNWTISWSLPQIVTSCANTSFCVTVDNSKVINNYRTNANELFARTKKALSLLTKNGGSAAKVRRLRSNAQRELTRALKISSAVPNNQSVCS